MKPVWKKRNLIVRKVDFPRGDVVFTALISPLFTIDNPPRLLGAKGYLKVQKMF